MLQLKKITPRYDAAEDRLVLNAQSADGQVAQLWCTQRLLNKLAAALSALLDQDLQRQAPAPAVRAAATQLHAMEQGAAQAQLARHEPVQPDAPALVALLASVDIVRRPNGMDLVFKDAQAPRAVVSMTPTELRQWLGIVHRLYGQAGWPTAAWPAWFKPSQPGDASDAAKALH